MYYSINIYNKGITFLQSLRNRIFIYKLDIYTITPFLRSLVFSLFTFCLLILFSEILEYTTLNSKKSIDYLYKYLLYSLPYNIAQVLPLSLMFATCFSMSQLNSTSELIAIFCTGQSFFRTIALHLCFIFLVSTSLIMANETILNKTIKLGFYYKSFYLQGKQKNKHRNIHSQNLRGKEGFYYIHYFDTSIDKVSYGFSYLQLDKEQTPVKFYNARNAYYNEQTKDWLLKGDVKITHFSNNFNIEKTEQLNEYTLKLPESASFFKKISNFPAELQFIDLVRGINQLKKQGTNPMEFIIELHNRLAYPFNCLILSLIGFFSSSLGSRRSGNSFVRALFLCTVIILIFYVTSTISTNLAKSGMIYPGFSSWLPALLYFALLLYYIRKNAM